MYALNRHRTNSAVIQRTDIKAKGMKTSHEPCHFFPPDLWSLTKEVCNTKSNKNSEFNLLGLFHHKLTITFFNDVSSIKKDVRGKDSFFLELPNFMPSSRHGLQCHCPTLCKKLKDGKTHLSLSSAKTWTILHWHQGKSSSVTSGAFKVILSSERFVTLQSSAWLCCQ